MDTGQIGRPTPSPSLNAPQRLDALASQGAVRTELPPEDTVQQVAEAETVRFEANDGARERAALDAALRETIRRRLTIEPKTREVVYQTIDSESGEVIRQVPDQALLRLRVYAREMRAAVESQASPTLRQIA